MYISYIYIYIIHIYIYHTYIYILYIYLSLFNSTGPVAKFEPRMSPLSPATQKFITSCQGCLGQQWPKTA